MVTHDSRKNKHCAVEKKKAETMSKLQKTRWKIIIIIVSVVHVFAREWTEAGATFYTLYISLKSNPADSARGLAVSNLRERQREQKQSFFDISRERMGAR